MMKNLIWLLFLFLAHFASAQSSGQGLAIASKHLDFGSISKPTTKSIVVYNRSASPVVIISSAVDCNCTVVRYSPKPIKSGDSTVVSIVYTPKDKGVFYKSVTLKNSTNKNLDFVVRGNVL